jgi:formyl-CoA transferase
VSATGFPDGAPVKAGGAVVDFSAGAHLAAAVLAALFQRVRTGQGQHVEVAMQDAIVPTLTSNFAGLLESAGEFPERTGNRHGGMSICPYNIYPAAGGWVAILCLRAKHWTDLCRLMGRPDLADDPALATPAGRVARMDLVDDAVTSWVSGLDRDSVFQLLRQAGIPAAPVRSLREVLHDPLLRDRGMLADIGEGARACTVLGSPLQLADSARPETWPATLLGEHTLEVLRGRLKLDDAEIEQLSADGVI